MSVQKYCISKDGSNFTTVQNKVIQGLKINLELLGFYLYLLSLPPEWTFYKTQLKETTGIGIKKLERFLNILAQVKLIEIAQMRNEKGQFAQFDLRILNGDSFNINNLDNCAPCVKNRRTDNGSTDLGSYKRNIYKINIEKENIKSICATENVAPSRFDEFWSVYPRKKDKKRAQGLWEKEKLDLKADLIIENVKERLRNDKAWQDENYIPHPSTYLKFERWNDEVILKSISNNSHKFNPIEYALDKINKRKQGKLS